MANNALGPSARLGLMNFTFMIPLNSRITTREFANMIRAGNSSPQAREVAQAIENVEGIIARDWRGTKCLLLTPEIAPEYYVRNAGWSAEKTSPYPTTPYQLVRLPHAGKSAPKSIAGNYTSPAMAYAAAATKLGMELPGLAPLAPVAPVDVHEEHPDENDSPAPAP